MYRPLLDQATMPEAGGLLSPLNLSFKDTHFLEVSTFLELSIMDTLCCVYSGGSGSKSKE